jgi:hypothetical protein
MTAAAQHSAMIASTVTEILLGGALTPADVVVGLLIVLFVKQLLRGRPV